MTSVPLEAYHCGNIGFTEREFTITAQGLDQPSYSLIIEVSSHGRHTKGLIPVVLMKG